MPNILPAAAAMLIAAGCVGAYRVLGTAAGAHWVAGRMVRSYAASSRLTIGGCSGSVARGFILYQVELHAPEALPPGSRLTFERVRVPPLSLRSLRRRARITLEGLRGSGIGAAFQVTAQRVTGNRAEGWTAEDVELSGVRGLPTGSAVKIQRIETAFPLRTDRIRSIRNGRVLLPLSDPIVFDGAQQAGRLDLHLFANTLTVSDLRELLPDHPALRWLNGSLSDLNVHIQGAEDAPQIASSFTVGALAYQRLVLARCPTQVSVRLQRRPDGWRVDGRLLIHGGALATGASTIHLQPSAVAFDGDPARPLIDAAGTATVKDTHIRISVHGRPPSPEVKLGSTPPLDQQQLLLMLLTGRSWATATTLFNHGYLSSDVATDFLDYVLWGGSGSRLANRLGISDLSLLYDPNTREVGAKTRLFGRVEAGYTIQEPTADTVPYPTQRVSAGYRTTEGTSIGVEAQKQLAPGGSAPNPASGSAEALTQPQHSFFDQVLMVFRKKF